MLELLQKITLNTPRKNIAKPEHVENSENTKKEGNERVRNRIQKVPNGEKFTDQNCFLPAVRIIFIQTGGGKSMKRAPAFYETVIMMNQLFREENRILMELVGDRIAHDTGTQLHTIQGLATLLDEQIQIGGAQNRLSSLKTECSRLNERIANILSFLREESPEQIDFNPYTTLRDMLRITNGYFMQKSVRIELAKPGSSVTFIKGSPGTFMAMIWRLFNEITGWGEQAGTISRQLSARIIREQGVLRLKIELQNYIIPENFELFMRTDPMQRCKTLQQYPTSWLILSAIVKKSRSQLLINSRKTGGSTMEIIFN